ncbi:MAG: cytochrome c [Candidatus Lindowbacteria bacterium]|nr:cytochrome c [Candidatus Lindowbacteria bacterium]
MKKQFWAGLITGIVLCGIIGGIIGSSMVGKKATVEPPGWEAYMAGKMKLMKIPEAAPPTTPVENTDENALTGGEHFSHHCAVCHDLEGDADSDFAKAFYPPVSDLTSPGVQKYSDGQLKWIVENGIRYTGMPGWTKIIDENTQWKIVYYTRALANPERAKKLEEILKERGLWKIEAPTAEDHHHGEEAEGEQPAHEREEPREHSHEGAAPGAAPEEEPHTHSHGEHNSEHH